MLSSFFKFLLIVVMLLLVGLVIFRSCEQKPPKSLTNITWTEKTEQAYLAAGESFSVLDCSSDQDHTTDGYFFIHDVIVLPEAEQWQFTISYNNSTLRYLEEEYAEEDGTSGNGAVTGTAETASAESDLYGIYSAEPLVYILYDGNGNIYDSYSYLEGSSALHSFRRLVFDGVPSDIETLTLAIYRARDIEITGGASLGSTDGAIAPWRWLPLKDESTRTKEHKISDGEAYTGALTEGLTIVSDAVEAAVMTDKSAE